MNSNNLKILLYFCLLLLGSACHPSRPVKKELKLADSLMEEHPDTALYVLKHIVDPEVMSEEEYAIYCLLSTQAADLTRIPHTSDSLITVAVNYFKNSNDLLMCAKSYYYMAKVKESMSEPVQAEENYLLAISTIEKTGNYKQAGEIYNSLSEFYLRSARYDESHNMQQKAYSNYLLANRNEHQLSPLFIILPGSLAVLLVLFVVHYRKKYKDKNKWVEKQEKQLTTAHLTIETQRTELNHLKKEVKSMKKFVYNSSEVVQKVQKINNITVSSKEKPSLTEHEWNSYLNILDETFGFISYLKQTYHKLTEIDLRICALLREGISTTHISTIMSMSPETLTRRMQRIKSEKMNQSKSAQPLTVILQQI